MSPSGSPGKDRGRGCQECGTCSPRSSSRPPFSALRRRPKSAPFIANNSDGYGVDRCLAAGATCGAAVATAYCKARDYAEAASFRRIEREEIAGAVPTTNGTSARDEFVAIECLR